MSIKVTGKKQLSNFLLKVIHTSNCIYSNLHKRYLIGVILKQKLKENLQNVMISVILTKMTLKWHLRSMENFDKLFYVSNIQK